RAGEKTILSFCPRTFSCSMDPYATLVMKCVEFALLDNRVAAFRSVMVFWRGSRVYSCAAASSICASARPTHLWPSAELWRPSHETTSLTPVEMPHNIIHGNACLAYFNKVHSLSQAVKLSRKPETPSMLISDKKHFIFIHIYKTAGSSIT